MIAARLRGDLFDDGALVMAINVIKFLRDASAEEPTRLDAGWPRLRCQATEWIWGSRGEGNPNRSAISSSSMLCRHRG